MDQSCDIVLIDGRRWYICPVPRCGFRTPVDAGQWSRDVLACHLQLHYVTQTCPCCGKAAPAKELGSGPRITAGQKAGKER